MSEKWVNFRERQGLIRHSSDTPSSRYHEQGANLTDNPDTLEKASIGKPWTAKSQCKAVPPGRAAFPRAW